MMTGKNWDTFYFGIMPMASVALGIASLCVAIWGIIIRQQGAAGVSGPGPSANPTTLGIYPPKVHYTNGDILVAVRETGRWYNLKDFVKPLDPDVQRIFRQVGPDAGALLDWVCRNITYRSDNGEWWEMPAETLRQRYADCDGSSILLASLLSNLTDCYVAVGSYRGFGHAWVVTDGEILEPTYTRARPVADPRNYRPYALFNDQEVIELWPGAMTNLYKLERNECKKLTAMAEAVSRTG